VKWTYDLAEHEQPLADEVIAPPDDLFVKLMEEEDFEPDQDARVFVLAVVEAKELKRMDRFGHNDVYVKFRLDYEPPPPEPASENEDDDGEDGDSDGDGEGDGDAEQITDKEAKDYTPGFGADPEPEPEPLASEPEPEPEPENQGEPSGEGGAGGGDGTAGDDALAKGDEAEKKPDNASKWKRTKTIVQGGEAPTWITDEFPDGAEFIFVGQTKVAERIEVEVYDEDIGTDDVIGRGKLVLGTEEYDMDMPAVSEDWQVDEWVRLTGDKMKKIDGEKVPEPTGQIHLMGKWIIPDPEPELPKQRLYITVFEAAELPKMDRFGENDVFVKIRTAGQGKQTSVAKGGGTEPKWNTGSGQVLGEKFMLTVAHMPREIAFQVFDQDLTKAELIGRGVLSLENQSPDGEWTTDRWIEIMDKKDRVTGKVKVGAKWEEPVSRLNPGKPEEMRQLHITVFSASKLKKMDLIGENDVYCSVHVSGKMKRTTTIVDGGSDCSWGGTVGETNSFKLLPECPTCVEIRCMDEDAGSADDTIGIGFLDFEEQAADEDWTIDKYVPLVDKKGKQFAPPSMVKIRASWKKPPPIRPGRLFVSIFEGRQLENRDGKHGKNDVYVEVHANKALKRTQTINDGGDAPVWEEGRGDSFKFTLRDMPVSVEVMCMDEDIVGSDDLIGRATVSLEALPRGDTWELDRWLPLRDAKGQDAGTLHCLFRWKPRPLPSEVPPVPYHLSGVWHGVGMERRTNRPLAPPFLTQPPVAYMNALKMLLVAESVLCCQVVAEALVKPENSAVYQLLFRFPATTEYVDDADEEAFLQEAFFAVDADRSGIIDREEFTDLCLRLDETMSQQEIDDAILRVDTDGDEEITLDEFKAWWIREDVRSATSGETGLRMAAMKEQMRLLVGEENADAPGPGSRWKCVRKAPVQAGVDMYSDEIGFVEFGEVIEAIDTVVMEGGQLRIFFYRGWTSTKPMDSLGTANYSEQDAQQMFDELDDDFSGNLDEDEVKELCLRLGRKLTKKGLADAMAAMDSDGNGTVEWEEFNDWWQANVNLFVQTDEVPTADPWTVAKMRHKRDAEEAEEVRREAHLEMENRRQRHSHTNRQLRSEKKILLEAEDALAEATRICDEHKAQYGLSEPQNLKKLQDRVTELTSSVDARQALVKILREQIELIQRGVETEEMTEDLAKRTAALEPGLRIEFRDERARPNQETTMDATVFLNQTTADSQNEDEDDEDSDEEGELLPNVEDFTHLGLPERSPMWWGTYCKAVATILERYEEQCIVRLTKRNMLWMMSQLHLVTITTVLTTKACLMAILRHRLIPSFVSMLDGKRRIWSGADCKLVYTARAVDRNIVTSASEVLQALLQYDSIVLDEHQVARLITIGILPDSDPNLAGPVLALLTRILLTNMHEGIGRLITPRDGTTKAIILEFLTNHNEVLYILRTRLRSAQVEVGTDGTPRLGYIRFAMVELTCAIAAHRYYVYRMVRQELFQSCVDLFFWFPWHSVLHAVVATALIQALKAASEEDRMDLLLSTRLVDRVCAVAKNMAVISFRGSRPNYSGHIWRICDTILNVSFIDDAVTGLLKGHRDWQWIVSHDLLAANALARDDWEAFQLVQNTAQTAAAGLFDEQQSRRLEYDIGAGYQATANKGAIYREAHNTEEVVGWCPVSSREKRVLLPYDSIAADSLRNRRVIDRPPPEQMEENATALAIDKTVVRGSQQDLMLIPEQGAAPVRYLHPTRRGMSYARSMQMDALKASRAIEAAQEKASKSHKTSFLVAPLLKSRMEDELGASASVWNKGRMGSRSALLGETLNYVRPLREDMVAFAAVAKQEHAENKAKRHRWPRLLRVRVVAARQLPKMDRGSSDPFCVVHYGKEKHETAVMHHDLEPVWEPLWAEGRWEHEFRFRLPERVSMKMPLLIEMYDEDKTSKNDPMGKVELPLTDLFHKEFGGRFSDGTEHGWYPLRRMQGMSKPTGELHVNIHCEWEQRPLKVEILEARDLPAMDHSGTSDPYAKLSCFDQQFQTQVIPKTLTPVWNETFELSVIDFHKTANMYVEVYDKDRIVHDDPMGRVIVPIDAVPGRCDPPGRLRWKAVAAGDVDPDVAAAEGAHEAWFPLTWLMMLDDAKDDAAAEAENQIHAAEHEAREEFAEAADDVDEAGASWPPENVDSGGGATPEDADDDAAEEDDGSDAEAEAEVDKDDAPMTHTAARGEVRLRLTWLPTAEEKHNWDQKLQQAERHQAGSAGPPGSPQRRKLRDARQQLPKLCAALLHSVTEDDAAGVIGLLRAHSELLRFACAVPIGGVETNALAAELLSLTSRPDMATRADAEVPCVATPLHIAARCGSSTVIDALLRCAEMEDPPLPLLERRDPNGRTALHCAASVASTGSVQVLLEWGANVLSFDYRRKLPVDFAEAYAGNLMPAGSCAQFLLDVTTDVATDGKPYAIIEGRVFGTRNPKPTSGVGADEPDRITWDYKGSGIRGAKEVDKILAGEGDDEILDDRGANSPAAKRKHEGAGGDRTNAYFIPTPATVPSPINKGHGKKGKVQGAPEGTRPMFVDRAKDALGIGLSKTARSEDEDLGIGEQVHRVVSSACSIQ
jgi:Ca2+-binding EF-hand superfamily protein